MTGTTPDPAQSPTPPSELSGARRRGARRTTRGPARRVVIYMFDDQIEWLREVGEAFPGQRGSVTGAVRAVVDLLMAQGWRP